MKRWGPNVMPPDEVARMVGMCVVRCPFCGSGMIGLFVGPLPHMTCGKCGADGPAAEQRDLGRAVRLWNDREVP